MWWQYFFAESAWVLQNSNMLILFLQKKKPCTTPSWRLSRHKFNLPTWWSPPPLPLSATSALCTAHKLLELSFKSFHWGLCHFTLSFVYWVEIGGWGGGDNQKKATTLKFIMLSLPLQCTCRVRQTFPARLSEQWRRQFLRAPSFLPPSLRLPSPMPAVSLDGRAHRNRGRNVLHIQPHNVHEQWPSIRWLAMSTWKEPLSSPENIAGEFMPAGTFHLGPLSQVGGNGWKYLNHKRDNYLD